MLHFLQMGSVGTFTSWHGVRLIGSSFQKRTLIWLGKAGYHSFPKHLVKCELSRFTHPRANMIL